WPTRPHPSRRFLPPTTSTTYAAGTDTSETASMNDYSRVKSPRGFFLSLRSRTPHGGSALVALVCELLVSQPSRDFGPGCSRRSGGFGGRRLTSPCFYSGPPKPRPNHP